jgi:signal peptidase I
MKSLKKHLSFVIAKEGYEWLDCIISALLIVVLILAFAARGTRVDGNSMLPTLENNQFLIISDLFYKPKYNDIIVLQANGLEDNGHYGKPIVKRVIGLPGDRIHIDFINGVVWRNNRPLELEEKNGHIYEDGHMINDYTHNQIDMPIEFDVPAGHVFVMGDNRNDSLDSRADEVGAVDERYIIGKVIWRVLPKKDFGSVYD